MPLFPVLGVLFIALKLMGYIAWSWWLILLPLYGGVALLLLVVLATAFGLAGYQAKSKRW